MRTRPTSITVICWLLIVVGAMAMIFIPLGLLYDHATRTVMDQRLRVVAGNLLPLSVEYAIGFTKVLVFITSGIAMLNGQKWARLLFTIMAAFDLLIHLTTAPVNTGLILGLIEYAVVVFFLFRPNANQYFGESRSQIGV
ncbi:MAG: hypothetical protein ACYCUV_01810 [Phycisphaerae bacterium]